MAEITKFTPYNNGEHALEIGYGDTKLSAGQHIKRGLRFYKVEEVRELWNGKMWAASLQVAKKERVR